MSFSLTGVYDSSNSGSVLPVSVWLPKIEQKLQQSDFWGRFLEKTWGGAKVEFPSSGKVIKVQSRGSLAAASTPLTTTEDISVGSLDDLVNADVTLAEYGNSVNIASFDEFCSNVDMQADAGGLLAENVVLTKSDLVGAAYVASANNFIISDSTTTGINGTPADGDSQLLAVHVSAIVNHLRTLGVAPMEDGFYRCVGRPGMFEGIMGESGFRTDASNLGLSGPHEAGFIGRYKGILFIDEMGANAKTVASASGTPGGHSVIFGRSAVVGWDNFNRKDIMKVASEGLGRLSRVGWYGYLGLARPVDTATTARSWSIYHTA